MLFNSLDYLLFFPFVVLLFYFIPTRARVLFLLVASYYFYMSWKVEYGLLIVLSTLVDYFAAKKIETSDHKKPWLLVSIVSNLGILFIFKYYNFFLHVVEDTTGVSPFEIHHLILPVGISFYTFQTLSYSIDVYRGKIRAERNLLKFALFVSFFPQLVAGPIERAAKLLPQLNLKSSYSHKRTVKGLIYIVWGLFLKVALADKLAPFVDQTFSNPENYDGMALLLSSYFFSFQIYGDFAGYSLIAIGSAEILGVQLMKNFNAPYLASSVSDFWRRWHISLSTWFKDYLYIPLGGNQAVFSKQLLNLMIVFIISGIWHGANYTFIVWGLIHGLFVSFERLWSRFKCRKLNPILSTLLTFHIVTLSWIFFRSNTVGDAAIIIRKIFTELHLKSLLSERYIKLEQLLVLTLTIFLVCIVDYIHNQKKESLREVIIQKPLIVRWAIYITFIFGVLLLGRWDNSAFIYFQF